MGKLLEYVSGKIKYTPSVVMDTSKVYGPIPIAVEAAIWHVY